MKQLLSFEMVRLYRRKLVLILPALIILIGMSGLWLNSIFTGTNVISPENKILGVYNAYGQFTFIFVSFVYISIFTRDRNEGIDYFLSEFGYSLPIQNSSKFLDLFLISALSANIFLLIVAGSVGLENWHFLFLVMSSTTTIFLWTISFSLLLSLLLKKTMLATIVNFGLYIIFDVCNTLLFGLINPADPNSLAFVTLNFLINHDVTHKSLSKVVWHFNDHTFLFSSVLPLLYAICVLLICTVYLIVISKKRGLAKIFKNY